MPPSARITIDAVIGLDLVGFLVASLALLVVALAVGNGLGHERSHRAGRRAGTQHTKELTTPQAQLALHFHSRALPSLRARSPRQRESFCFDLDEETPDSADMAVEIGSLGNRQISEEASDPRSEMLLEDLPLPLDCRRKLSADQTGHDLAENSRVVFRFELRLD